MSAGVRLALQRELGAETSLLSDASNGSADLQPARSCAWRRREMSHKLSPITTLRASRHLPIPEPCPRSTLATRRRSSRLSSAACVSPTRAPGERLTRSACQGTGIRSNDPPIPTRLSQRASVGSCSPITGRADGTRLLLRRRGRPTEVASATLRFAHRPTSGYARTLAPGHSAPCDYPCKDAKSCE